MTPAELGAPVGAVVAAYQPDAGLPVVLASLVGQVDAVVVVDDGTPEGTPGADRVAAVAAPVRVVRHPANRGIAAALNTGTAALGDVAWVLTMDQDSELPPGYVAALLAAGERAAAAGVRVGMVAPDAAAGVARSRRRRVAEGVEIGGEPIQSGLLVARALLDELGGFDEGLVIDGVDTDLWLRANARGWACVAAPGVRLEHRLGNPRTVRLPGGRTLGLTVASDRRNYYRVRNLIGLVRGHGLRDPRWAAGALAREVRHLAVTNVLVPGRARRLAYAGRGLLDGLRGVRGPVENRRP